MRTRFTEDHALMAADGVLIALLSARGLMDDITYAKHHGSVWEHFHILTGWTQDEINAIIDSRVDWNSTAT